jgi:hypothetical protein
MERKAEFKIILLFRALVVGASIVDGFIGRNQTYKVGAKRELASRC